jgi:3' terminal RNA ribose 2'-O-methyltransferase Hen1
MDVSHRALENAGKKLRLDRMPERQRQRIELIQGSLVYRDARLAGYDAVVLMEVIEHLDPNRLASFERVVFEFARPRFAVVTTPNAEYNVKFEDLPVGHLRHRDHRFEWNREEFRSWAEKVAEQNAYGVRYLPVGTEDASIGAPTQLALFSRE